MGKKTKVEESPRTFKLGRFVENPDNPQTVTDAAFERLVGKLKRVPKGLTARRIAYVTDHEAGEFVVISGNKRIRALKRMLGEEYEAPAEWFQDVTSMTEAERNEFIIDANVNEGKFDADKMREMYSADELKEWVGAARIGDLIEIAETSAAASAAGEGTGEADDATKLVELRISLKGEDYKSAVAVLRGISEDLGVAFMRVVNGRS